MREELHPAGFELIDVCLEMGGSDIARFYVDQAASTHPSLIDRAHLMDARFGVINIPSVLWIDEEGQVVRPPEPASPPPVGATAEGMARLVGDLDRREGYLVRLRDWVSKGSGSRYALSADEVQSRSQPRSAAESRAAAHFELAQHIWRQEGLSERALLHFNAAHELQPDNITYKRQAYSVVGVERTGDTGTPDNPADIEMGRFRQAPAEGEDWPFVSDFNRDLITHNPELAKKLGLT